MPVKQWENIWHFNLNSWFSITSYQNSQVITNVFPFQNVYGIVESYNSGYKRYTLDFEFL